MAGSMRYANVESVPQQWQESVRKQLATPRAGKARMDREHQEQVVFFNRIRTLALNDKRYALAVRRTHAIPNGGARSKRAAGRLKAEGVTPGVSDVHCALPCAMFHGLYIEMKSMTGSPSREQRAWLAECVDLGYSAAVCRGAAEAFAVWKAYVDGTLQ